MRERLWLHQGHVFRGEDTPRRLSPELPGEDPAWGSPGWEAVGTAPGHRQHLGVGGISYHHPGEGLKSLKMNLKNRCGSRDEDL